MHGNRRSRPTAELSQPTRTFARMITSLIEDAEAVDGYGQRLSLERDSSARANMHEAQKEAFDRSSVDLEWLPRH